MCWCVCVEGGGGAEERAGKLVSLDPISAVV